MRLERKILPPRFGDWALLDVLTGPYSSSVSISSVVILVMLFTTLGS